MGLAIGGKKVGGLAIGDKVVGGLAIGDKIVWLAPLTAPVITSDLGGQGRIGLTIRVGTGATGYLIEVATVVNGERGAVAPVTDGLTFTETPELGPGGEPTGKTLRSYEWPMDAGTYDVFIRALRGDERGPASTRQIAVR